MRRALDAIGRYWQRAAAAGVTGHRQYNNGWHTAMDLKNLLTVSEAITRAALLRRESRGAQFRDDYPEKDPEWGKYNNVVRRGENGEMVVEQRPLTPMPDPLKQVIEEMK
jgi:succinate dehydrogenase / fumarate reductase flavoprotein subunit